jgi:hypothetical protein
LVTTGFFAVILAGMVESGLKFGPDSYNPEVSLMARGYGLKKQRVLRADFPE